MAKKEKEERFKIAAENRKARHNYYIESTIEAGVLLAGTEVKALREGHATIGESYAHTKDGEVFLVNAYIPEYKAGNRFNHEVRRVRKLLLHKREIAKLAQGVEREGMTLIPLKLYFNPKGRAKIELGLAKGKKIHDKRDTEKKRDWEREKGRLMRVKG